MVYLTVNHNISKITQPVAIQSTFVMSYLDKFSQRNNIDTKRQTAKTTEIKFPTVNRKKRKKILLRYSFVLSING